MSLSTNQKIFVAAIGALLVYGLFVSLGSGRFSAGRLSAMALIIFVALPVHEFAHAAMAVALGDSTPRLQGRYTLNPLVHIDPIGALLILFAGFGWAKPVQWNPRNISMDPRGAAVLVAIVGPLSNILLACLCILVFSGAGAQTNPFLGQLIYNFVLINVVLFVFNMLPIPPLDGSHVLFALFPGDTFQLRKFLSRWGFFVLIGIIFLVPQIILAPTTYIVQLLFTVLT